MVYQLSNPIYLTRLLASSIRISLIEILSRYYFIRDYHNLNFLFKLQTITCFQLLALKVSRTQYFSFDTEHNLNVVNSFHNKLLVYKSKSKYRESDQVFF